jgi:hypothetical protein
VVNGLGDNSLLDMLCENRKSFITVARPLAKPASAKAPSGKLRGQAVSSKSSHFFVCHRGTVTLSLSKGFDKLSLTNKKNAAGFTLPSLARVTVLIAKVCHCEVGFATEAISKQSNTEIATNSYSFIFCGNEFSQ